MTIATPAQAGVRLGWRWLAGAVLALLRGRAWTAALAGVVLSIGSAHAQSPARFVEIAAVPSANIPPPRVTIWLPPGYDGGKARYAVVYMHDGQNVFFPARSGFNKVWGADASALRLIAGKRVAPFIVVAIDHPGAARERRYFPQALYAAATPGLRAKFDRMMQGAPEGDAYLRFLTDDLKPLVDREFRTRPDARHTAIVGSSMGGLISCYAFVERPRVFGRAACVSTHWPLADPADVGPFEREVATLWQRYFAARLGKPGGRRLWMDHGTATLDALYPPWQRAIDADLIALGWKWGQDFESREYAGAAHEENAWAARLDDILAWLLR